MNVTVNGHLKLGVSSVWQRFGFIIVTFWTTLAAYYQKSERKLLEIIGESETHQIFCLHEPIKSNDQA